MRIAVIGAGIVGVTTAYELAVAGHEVTVFERRDSVASEASFANAGVVAPGYVTPWAAPGMPWKVLRHLFGSHAPVRLQGLGGAGAWPWIWRWWRACGPEVHAANRAAMQRLARFSQARLRELTQSLQLRYEQRSGCLVLLRDDRDLALSRGGLKLLAESGVAFELLDAARARAVEPGLHTGTPLRAAIHLPHDGVGNCRQFAQALKAHAQRLGAQFRFSTTVQRVGAGGRATPAASVVTAAGEAAFDAVVLCSGVESNHLLQPIGRRLPLLPVWGYSITAPLRQLDGHPDPGPRAALIDERYKVAVSRLGQRVRVAGCAEIGGTAGHFSAAAIATLYRVLDDWFPGAAAVQQAQRWKGARPMLPDGPPVLGPSGAAGVWLNLGHGSSGWALACGSALVLAEQISGRAAPIDVSRLGADRFGR